ncbi:MAG: DUF2635 domain-containing protein [Psychromonas sp.]
MVEIKVKPATNLLVRDPITREALQSMGELKPRNPYWLRRIKDGSVTELKAKKEVKS